MPIYTLNIPKDLTIISHNPVQAKSKEVEIGGVVKEHELGL